MLYSVLRNRLKGGLVDRDGRLVQIKREGRMKTKDPVQGALLAEELFLRYKR